MGCPIATDRDVLFVNVWHIDGKSQRVEEIQSGNIFRSLSHTDRHAGNHASTIVMSLAHCFCLIKDGWIIQLHCYAFDDIVDKSYCQELKMLSYIPLIHLRVVEMKYLDKCL